MCLLCFSTDSTAINWSGLETACANNPDGFGWSLHLGDHLLVGRSLDSSTALQTYWEATRSHPGAGSMFHARWATHGPVTLDNCHPFALGQTSHTLIGHNGILDVEVPKGSMRSDTRIFCETLLPRQGIRALDNRRKRAALEAWLGGSKLVIFTTLEKMSEQVYILNEHQGEWVDGTWWSNDSYIPSMWSRWAVPVLDSTGVELCGICRLQLDDDAILTGYCSSCSMCLDCWESRTWCECYSPSR